MKIDQQQLEDQQVRLTVELEPTQVEEAKQRAARRLAKDTKIPGFRPGKAPYPMIERYIGAAAILEEAIEILVNDVYPKAIEESAVRPYGPGSLENIPSQDPLTFEFLVPLSPQVELGDYSAIRIPYELEPLDESQVEQTIENIREQQAVVEPVDRPAQEADEVSILLKADRKNAAEGEPSTFIRERSVPIIIRTETPAEGSEETQPDEWPYPGFSRQLIGLSVGDERTTDYTFPEDSTFEMLRGTVIEYSFKVESVKSRTLPPVDDELAKSMGEYETLEELRKEIRERLEAQSREAYDRDFEDKLINELVKDASVKYPPQALRDEIDSMIRQLENRLGTQGLDMGTYLKSRNMDLEALREEIKPTAETRLKQYLAVIEVAKKEAIQIPPETVTAEAARTLEAYSQSLPPEKARKGISQDMVAALVDNIHSDLTVRKSLDRLKAIAKGEGSLPAEAPTEAKEAAAQVEGEAGAAGEAAVPPEAETAAPEAEVVEEKPRKKRKSTKVDKPTE